MGGSSQLNYLLHLDMSGHDLQRWKANGAVDWKEQDFPTDSSEDGNPCEADNDDGEDDKNIGFRKSEHYCSPDFRNQHSVIVPYRNE